MTEIQLKDMIQKAHRAEELLNDPMIQEFIIAVRGDLLNEFESAELKDDRERMNTWNQAQVFKRFLAQFQKKIKAGKNARLTLVDRARNLVNNR